MQDGHLQEEESDMFMRSAMRSADCMERLMDWQAIFLPYVMRAYGDAACKKLAELSDVCRLTTPQESDSVKADAFIGWIEELKVKMQIPQYPEMIRKADVKQIAKWAEKEANPLYPTPEVWNRREFERFLLNVCVQGSSEKDRQCCQDK